MRSALQRTRRQRRTAERVSHSTRPSRGLREQASRAPGYAGGDSSSVPSLAAEFYAVLRTPLDARIQRARCAPRKGQAHWVQAGGKHCVFNITSVMQSRSGYAAKRAASHNACYVWRPRPAFVAARFVYAGATTLPLHPGLCGRAIAPPRLCLFPWPALRVAFARLQPCGLTLRARCAVHPSAPKGAPFKAKARSPLGSGCGINPSRNRA